MTHSQNYRWVSQPRQFPGQQLDRVNHSEAPAQIINESQAPNNIFQALLQMMGDVLTKWSATGHRHSWE